jgi:hypothetical protein
LAHLQWLQEFFEQDFPRMCRLSVLWYHFDCPLMIVGYFNIFRIAIDPLEYNSVLLIDAN